MKMSIKNLLSSKIIVLCALLLLQSLHATMNSELKVRGSAFIPTGHLFREIYGTAGGSFDVEFATNIRDYLQAWANYDWFGKSGHSVGLCSPTKIHISSISFGLKYPYDIKSWLRLYLGLGPSFALIKINNQTCCSNACANQSSIGFVVKTGADFYFNKRGFVDVFLDYAYQKTAFECRTDVGSVRIGAGLGVAF